MQFHLGTTQKASVLGSPVTAAGSPSQATLSNPVYSSSDESVFTVADDPAVPGGAIITASGAGTATLTETATATELDGKTTESIQGSATIIVVAPVDPAASIVFTFGDPVAV